MKIYFIVLTGINI